MVKSGETISAGNPSSSETKPDLVVHLMDSEPWDTGTLTRLFREGAFLLMHLDPDVTKDTTPTKNPIKIVRNVFNPQRYIEFEGDIEDDEHTHIDWEGTARKSAIKKDQLDAPALDTLTLHDIPIIETGERITIDFEIVDNRMVELSAQAGAQANLSQVVNALWNHFKKVRTGYYLMQESADHTETS